MPPNMIGVRFRILSACVISAVLLVVPRADAETRDVSWTFDAQRTSDATITVKTATEITVDAPIQQIAVGEKSPDTLVAKKGLYGGIIIRDRKGDVAFGMLRYSDSRLLISWGQYDSNFRQVLSPGTYRVTVLGQSATTIRLPVRGQSLRRVVATRPSHVVARNDSVRTPAALFVQPLRVRSTTAYLALSYLKGGSNVPVNGLSDVCVTHVDKQACLNADVSNLGTTGGVGVGYEGMTVLFGYPHAIPLPAGDYEARLQQVAAGEIREQALFTLSSD